MRPITLPREFEKLTEEQLSQVNQWLEHHSYKDVRQKLEETFHIEITTDKLALALKGADSTLTHKVTSNMSVRAAEIFVDDLENMGPVRVSDVEQAQKEILAIAKQMADSGQIVLSEANAAMIG